MFKSIGKILTGAKTALKKGVFKRLFKNPLFYFGIGCFLLFGVTYSSCDSQSASGLQGGRFVFLNTFLNKSNGLVASSLFSSQSNMVQLETPDLKIIQENTLGGMATPSIVSGKVLGDIF
ncbi:MAG: hypothetical protein NT026_02615 [Candidatus Staskawiczbacteria bacterium]|nr:hypothetical protein [Candidatus Staskawiczbacteria bacterium]